MLENFELSTASEHDNYLWNALHSRWNITTFALPVRALLESHFTVRLTGRGGPTERPQLNPHLTSFKFLLYGWAEGEVYQNQTTWTGHRYLSQLFWTSYGKMLCLCCPVYKNVCQWGPFWNVTLNGTVQTLKCWKNCRIIAFRNWYMSIEQNVFTFQ